MNVWQEIRRGTAGGLLAVLATSVSEAGPYSAAMLDGSNGYDAPVPGFTGPHGPGKARLDTGNGFLNEGNRVNPLFFGWAADYSNYERSDSDTGYNDPAYRERRGSSRDRNTELILADPL